MKDPFEYRPPTPTTAPKYDAIRKAEASTEEALTAAINAREAPAAERYAKINAATKAFFETIERECPPSDDTSAALRCVRLARMAANECVAEGLLSCSHIAEHGRENLRAARWQACAAVALHDWPELVGGRLLAICRGEETAKAVACAARMAATPGSGVYVQVTTFVGACERFHHVTAVWDVEPDPVVLQAIQAAATAELAERHRARFDPASA